MRYFAVVLIALLLVPELAFCSLWGHILTYKGVYRWPPKQEVAAESRWWAAHYDMITFDKITPDRNPEKIKRVNGGATVLKYVIDLAPYQSDTPKIEAFLAKKGYPLEESFLHFSEDTVITTPKGDVFIKGSNGKTRENRMQTYIWTSTRWIMNMRSRGYREYLQQAWTAPADNPGKIAPDGFFIDEHGNDLPLCRVKSGGGILEYGGKKAKEVKDRYNAEVCEYLAEQRKWAGKRLVIVNTAEYMDRNVLGRGEASGGVLMEFLISPKRQSSGVVASWDFVNNLARQGRVVVMNTAHGLGIPDGYTPGVYSSAKERGCMYALACYYMAKDAGNEKVYFQIGGGWDRPLIEQWIPAQETNVGKPLGNYRLYASGKDGNRSAYSVYARDFSRALVLFRARDVWNYSRFDDSTAAPVDLPPGVYRLLLADGRTVPVGRSIRLRNAEAAILLKGDAR